MVKMDLARKIRKMHLIDCDIQKIQLQLESTVTVPIANAFGDATELSRTEIVPSKDNALEYDSEEMGTSGSEYIPDELESDSDYGNIHEHSPDEEPQDFGFEQDGDHMWQSANSEKSNDPVVKDNFNNNTDEKNTNHSMELSGLDLSINLESVGSVLKDGVTTVKPSGSGPKKHFCLFCEKPYSRLIDHVETKHRKEQMVKKLLEIPKMRRTKNQSLNEEQFKRQQIANEIRRLGDHQHNLKTDNPDDFVVSRRPRKCGKTKTVRDFLPCPKCHEWEATNSLAKHVTKCTKKNFKRSHSVKQMALSTIGNLHQAADANCIRIFEKLREDEVKQVLRHDEVVIKWLTVECVRYETSRHHDKMIRAKLRRLGRLILNMRKNCEKLTDLKSAFDETYYENFVKAAKTMGCYDKDTHFLKTPATANDIGLLMKDVCSTWIVLCGRKDNKTGKKLRKKADRWLFAHSNMWHKLIGSNIGESQAKLKRKKKTILPSQSDIRCLHEHLKKVRDDAIMKLQTGYNELAYNNLKNATLTSIQFSNCKRAGEIERLTVEDCENVEELNEETNPDGYSKLSEESKEYVRKYSRILIRGKRNRTVPILLTLELRNCISTLIHFRKNAGIRQKNPYLFALPYSKYGYISACENLRRFSYDCNATDPETLRGTLFRKQLATTCLMFDLREYEVGDLAKFMGHDDKIHKDHYRQPVLERDLINVAKLLEKAQGIYGEHDSKNGVDEVTPVRCTIEEDNGLDESYDSEPEVLKRKRIHWDEESQNAILQAFPDVLNSATKLPTGDQINSLIKKTPVLRNRTEPRIRSWLHIQRKKNEKQSTGKQGRNTVPTFIHSVFSKHIKSGKIPTYSECVDAMAKSPSTMTHYSVDNLKNLVAKAIKNKAN